MITVRYILARLDALFVLLPLLTARKILNLLRATTYFLMRSERSVDHPPMMVLALTSRCNFSCIMCKKSSTKERASLFNYDQPKDLDIDALEELLEEHRDHLCMVYLHGGEPLYHQHIDRLLDRLNEWRIPFQIGTNGSLLTKDRIRTLVDGVCVGVSVSIDGFTADTYEMMRPGGDHGQLVANLVELNRLKSQRRSRRPVLTASMCVFSQNLSEMIGMVEFCHEHAVTKLSLTEGWDYTTPGIREEHLIRNNVEPARRALEQAKSRAKELGVLLVSSFPSFDEKGSHSPITAPGSERPRNCLNLYASTWIMPDQGVLGCSSTTAAMGNLRTNTFDDIWNGVGAGYVQARRDLKESRVPAGCARCIYTGSFFS